MKHRELSRVVPMNSSQGECHSVVLPKRDTPWISWAMSGRIDERNNFKRLLSSYTCRSSYWVVFLWLKEVVTGASSRSVS